MVFRLAPVPVIGMLQPANTDDRVGTLPALPRLAALGFEGDLLGDSGFKGAPFAAAALAHDIHVSVSPGVSSRPETRSPRGLPRDWGSGCGGHWRERVIGGVETLPEVAAERAIVDGAANLEQPVGATP